MTPALASTDLDTPSTGYFLRIVADSLRAQPDETPAEYEERFTAAASAWRAFNPRDQLEQWVAGQLVAAHHAALDNLTRAMETPDNGEAAQLRGGHAGLVRTIESLMRQLEQLKQRPDESLVQAGPAEAIQVPKPLRPRAAVVRVAGKAAAVSVAPAKTPREMTDEELSVEINAMRKEFIMALFDPKSPHYPEAVAYLPDLVPDIVLPERFREVAVT